MICDSVLYFKHIACIILGIMVKLDIGNELIENYVSRYSDKEQDKVISDVWIQCLFSDLFQIYILDGDQLKDDPIEVMDKLQKYLRIEPYFDYNQKIR